MIQTAMEFWRQHIVLANITHAVGGFGLAVVLQRYVGGRSFLPVLIGWILLGYSLGMHLYAYTR